MRRAAWVALAVGLTGGLAACEEVSPGAVPPSSAPSSAATSAPDAEATGAPPAAGQAETTASAPDAAAPAPAPEAPAPASPSAAPAVEPGENPFDVFYPSEFSLTPLSDDAWQQPARPERATGFDGPHLVSPAYDTRIYRATDAAEGQGGRMRHEYSRRQAFNADNSRYLAQDAAGYWYLYDATTFAQLEKLPDLAGDCEPLWDATNPNLLHFTARNGGPQWYTRDIAAGKTTPLFDLTGKTPWPEAAQYTTRGEGTTSADGRFLALTALTYNQATGKHTVYGLLVVDLTSGEVVGTLDAAKFPKPHQEPDHISISPSGKYVVPSWGDDKGEGGTWAYSRDFSAPRKLHYTTEHSDLAFGPQGQDYYVYADYKQGELAAIDLATGERFVLTGLYPQPGEGYALHISGQAFDKQGWVVVSTYADYRDYQPGKVAADQSRAPYRKVWLAELKPEGRLLNVAHTQVEPRQRDDDEAYFAEPQATASRDLSRIMFASDWGGEAMESYIVGLPSWVLD